MGYYTQHELKIIDNPDDVSYDDVVDALKEISGYQYLLEEFCKWYDSNKDMEKLSAKFPTVVFELMGHGEDAGDIWKQYFTQGKLALEVDLETIVSAFEKHDFYNVRNIVVSIDGKDNL